MGWGVQTWALAAMMALEEHPRADFIVFSDTHHESQATYDFAQKWTPWLGEHGLNVVTVEAKEGRTDVVVEEWSNSVTIPAFTTDAATGVYGQVRRQCTHDWKIMPIRRFIRQELARQGRKVEPECAESWLGISLDEFQRMRSSDVKYVVNCYPLVERRIRRIDCISWLEQHELPVPPKSACTFCPFKSIAAWKGLKREGGPDWNEALTVDTAIRYKRQKGEGKPGHEVRKGLELFVHPARVPLPAAVTIPEDEGAYQTSMDIGCEGGYCMV